MSNASRADSTALVATEVGELTAEQRRKVDDVAVLFKNTWTTLEKASPSDLKTIGRIIVAQFPTMMPLEILKYFEILGGKLYDKAEFWLAHAAKHPDYRGADLHEIAPGTTDWGRFIGSAQDPKVIAAAVKCVAHRRVGYDEAKQQEIWRTETEASYVLTTDSMLGEYTYTDYPQATSRAQADQLAKAESELRGLTVDRVGKYQDKPWSARFVTPKADAIALANKKARTTASRRTLRRLFAIAEARVDATIAQVNARLERIEMAGGARTMYGKLVDDPTAPPWHELPNGLRIRAGGSAGPQVKDVQADYGEEPAAATPAPPPGPIEQPIARSTVSPAPADQTIDEPKRRNLYTLIDKRDISRLTDLGAHEALHALLRELRHLAPNEPASTKSITWTEYPELVAKIEGLPLLPDDQGQSDGGTS